MFNNINENVNLPITSGVPGETAMVPNSKKIFARNLERIRTQRELTQDALAKLVGVVPSQISLYEKAKSGVSLEIVDKLAKALAVPPSAFLDQDPEKIAAWLALEWRPPAREITLKEAVKRLNAEGGPIVFKQRSKPKTKAIRIKNS